MRLNYIGIIGVILAFVSLALPWWVMSISAGGATVQVSVYPYQATAASETVSLNLWYGWTALAFVIIGGFLGLAGSIINSGRKLLALAGILVLLSIIVFAAGLQNDISNGSLGGSPFPTGAGLFSSGSYEGVFNYSTYLSFGFWLALVAAIIMFVGLTRKPSEATTTTPPPQPSPTAPM